MWDAEIEFRGEGIGEKAYISKLLNAQSSMLKSGNVYWRSIRVISGPRK